MRDKSVNNIKELYFRLLPAQIFVVITSSLSGLVNGLITGNYLSSEAMVALGFVTPLVTIFGAFSAIISGGAGILCGRFMGRGEPDKVNKVFTISNIILLICGVVLTAACLLFSSGIATVLGSTGETTANTAIYIRGLAIGIIPLLIVPLLMTFLQMCNRANFSLIATAILAVFNCIFGLLNVKVVHAGIFGVGISTSLSYFVVLLVIIYYFIKEKSLVKLEKNSIDYSLIVDTLKFGFPGAFVAILYNIRNMIINRVALNVGGAVAVNALAILTSVGGFYDAFNIGVANAARMLASVFIGERDKNSVKKLANYATLVGLIIGFGKVVFIYLTSRSTARLFGATGDVIPMTQNLLNLYSWSMPINMIFGVALSVYCSIGKLKISNILYSLNALIVPLIVIYVFPSFMGVNGIWICYFVAEVVLFVIMVILAIKKLKRIPKCASDLVDIENDFGMEERYSRSIKTIDEVIGLSKDIDELCKKNGIDAKRTYIASLCTEEMAANIVEHGFIKDKKDNTIDVLAFVENGDVHIRFRDNCVPFNPNDRLHMDDGDDPCKNIGIKMVSKLAKEMNYQITFGMNILSITI